MKKIGALIKSLGPGLLYAGAAVGVSHLVQSTRAGADFGFQLLWVLIIVNLIKYPFFEIGTRYAAATGKSLIEGYAAIGKWALILFVILQVSTMFAVLSAVSMVTAGIIASVFNLSIQLPTLTAIILIICMIVLIIGKYSLLDKLIKYIILILALSTLLAISLAFIKEPLPIIIPDKVFNLGSKTHLLFLIAFIGWMPAPIDVSVWQSMWNVEKYKKAKGSIPFKSAMFDFRLGYFGTMILAIMFLSLGAMIMYNSGLEFSQKGVVFSNQLINIYTSAIGSWAKPLIAIAAIVTMLSTTITVMDAFPRVLAQSTKKLMLKKAESKSIYIYWMIILISGCLLMINVLSGSMIFFVDMATSLSFITAPMLAFLNIKALNNPEIAISFKLKKGMLTYAWVGIFLMSIFATFYVFWRIFY